MGRGSNRQKIFFVWQSPRYSDALWLSDEDHRKTPCGEEEAPHGQAINMAPADRHGRHRPTAHDKQENRPVVSEYCTGAEERESLAAGIIYIEAHPEMGWVIGPKARKLVDCWVRKAEGVITAKRTRS